MRQVTMQENAGRQEHYWALMWCSQWLQWQSYLCIHS